MSQNDHAASQAVHLVQTLGISMSQGLRQRERGGHARTTARRQRRRRDVQAALDHNVVPKAVQRGPAPRSVVSGAAEDAHAELDHALVLQNTRIFDSNRKDEQPSGGEHTGRRSMGSWRSWRNSRRYGLTTRQRNLTRSMANCGEICTKNRSRTQSGTKEKPDGGHLWRGCSTLDHCKETHTRECEHRARSKQRYPEPLASL